MARFETDGLDDLIREMKDLGVAMTGEIADKMLLAGAEQVKIAWRNAIIKHHHRKSDQMLESIGYAREPKYVLDVRYIDIYPQGTDDKGVRNAEKAFMKHYGTSKHPGSHWVDDADAECGETVVPAMEQAMNEELKKRGM